MISAASASHLVLIPSYNTGAARLLATIRAARAVWSPVWVVIDGSTDGSAEAARALAARDPDLRVLTRARNGGKGLAVLDGLREARRHGFSHVLTMDADGQHPPDRIAPFMAVSRSHPRALVLGLPQFDDSAPGLRLFGRKIANWWANVETSGAGIGDCLFGFRIYPVAELLDVMERTRWMRGFDFDPEACVRLSWLGLPVINLPAPVKYFRPEDGGVSHFNYLRDNALLAWMNLRLMMELLLVRSVSAWSRRTALARAARLHPTE